MILPIILAIGLCGTLFLLVSAFKGPSTQKSIKKRLELMKERHSESVLAANANAQIRKLMQARENRVESMASSLIPKPALLRKRLDQTGRQINLGKYAIGHKAELVLEQGEWLCIIRRITRKYLPDQMVFRDWCNEIVAEMEAMR